MKQVLVITGGSSGIGKAAAELFGASGYKVYELSRHGESAGNITHIDCDVTSSADCKRAIKAVIDAEAHINVLISNAGFGISGAVEFTEETDWKRQMDVNFNGAVNIAQAALPFLRQQSGEVKSRIIFTSSMAAQFPIPFQAFYTASKYAINGFAMALRNEVRPFGIEVCCLLPGDVKTGFTNSRKEDNSGAEFYPRMKKAVEQMARDEQNGQQPAQLAKKLLSLAQSRCPAPYSTVGIQYKLFRILGCILPERIVSRILYMMY